jgi:hypothetical protein
MDVGYRSLADQLRSWPGEQLARLLTARPDLTTPAPLDSGQLAARSATRSSLLRALDGLDHLELTVLHALLEAGPAEAAQAVDDLPAEPGHARAALARLVDLALVWESTHGLRPVTGLGELPLVPPGLSLDGPADGPPALVTSPREAALVDRAAAGAAFETVRRVELLLDGWGAVPPGALRSGGLAVRDLKAAATRLHVDEPTAALLIEVAATAGLLATGPDDDGNLAWLPTVSYDAWVEQPPAARWTTLARAWLASARTPGLVGQRDTAGKTWNALVAELVSPTIAETRRMTLAAMATLPPGEVLASGTGGPSMLAHLAWLRPRRPANRAGEIAWTFTESAALGVTALGGLASYARLLLTGDEEATTDALGQLMPEPVDHVLLQADLTAVAPGPLETHLARRLGIAAEVESRGGATVYRFTPASVRRAMDLGWSAVELHEFVADVSRTPVPQPLTYLIDDTARTFGVVRVGFAEAFLRADDEHALTEVLHHPAAASLGLRRLAPTVLISTTPLDVLLPRLREAGFAPVVEAADGSVHVARPDAQRSRTPRRTPDGIGAARDAARVNAVVVAVRAGDQAAASRPAAAEALNPSGALAALREAIDAGTPVVIGYVDNHGTRTDRVIRPLSVDGGQLRAHDARADDVRLFAVHRISSVRPA